MNIRGHMGRLTARLIALCVALPMLSEQTALAAAPTAQPVPTPTVSTPPPGRGKPFRFSIENIGRVGYVEEEYFIEGTARSYVPTAELSTISDGRWDATPTGPTAHYLVRMIIRRPSDPAKFNGTVLVDWLNVSAGYDSDTFDTFEEPFMRQGYVYVGVSAQAIGVNHMRKWDTERYSKLEHPGDSFSYDIFSQAARALRQGQPAPLGDLTSRIKNLVGWGGSQSGGRLVTYINAVHPNARVIDGFVPFIAAWGAPLVQSSQQTGMQALGGAALKIRTDVDTPVLFQISESEVINAARGIHLQPDSEHFRMWEYAGLSHANSTDTKYTFKRAEAHGLTIGMFPACETPVSNDVSSLPVFRATLDAMHRWLTEDEAPAHAPRMELSIPGDATQPATIVRDPATGMVKGGIRLPPIAVPTATYWGGRPAGKKEHQACWAFGSMDPWNSDSDPGDADPATDISPRPEPKPATLYKNTAGYVKAVEKSANELAAQGFIAKYDIAAYIEQAKRVTIP